LLLALCAGPALALGLGQIEVRSQRDQPLLAEIQIISSNPAELDALQARLASPDTFRRIGLEPPQGIVSDLQFAVALDARGRPVIRVTSSAPVRQSLLTFLVEVDWGQGRLVREYSALLDAPRTVSAPAQPPIEAPVAAPSNTIERPAQASPAEPVATTQPEPTKTAPVPQAAPPAEETPDPDAVAASPAPTPVAPAPTPATAAPVPETPAPGNEYGPVKAGDTLGKIAAGLRPEGATLDQTMVALLRANPEAFIGGNLNLVRQGVVLRMPPAAEMSQYGAAEATAVVREQIAQWREMRRPAPQPEAVAGDNAAPVPAATPGAAGSAPRVADARLEITPPSPGGAARAGTRSGIEAGGEGEMLRQELQQTKESLAARDAEVAELKARVADLEKLQQQQQQLISLKDSELAAAQQRLAASNKQLAPTLAQATTTPATKPPASAANAESGSLMWLWIGLALIGAGLLAWWLSRRRTRPAPPSRVFNTATLAAGMPKAANAQTARAAEPPAATPREAAPAPVTAEPQPAPPPAAPAAPPAWNAPGLQSVEMTPTWHNGKSGRSSADIAASAAPVAPSPAPAGQERIELARAYIDLGDTDTARTLLQEVADGGDAASRSEASRLLRELA
jgi:pilus assembly protein FimV